MDTVAPYLYDAVLVYAYALNEAIKNGKDTRSGADVSANFAKSVFVGT